MASSREREYSEGSSCPVPATERIARDQVAQFPGTRVQRGIKLPSSREREDSEGYQVAQFPGPTAISLWLFWTWMAYVAGTLPGSCVDGETGAHAGL